MASPTLCKCSTSDTMMVMSSAYVETGFRKPKSRGTPLIPPKSRIMVSKPAHIEVGRGDILETPNVEWLRKDAIYTNDRSIVATSSIIRTLQLLMKQSDGSGIAYFIPLFVSILSSTTTLSLADLGINLICCLRV